MARSSLCGPSRPGLALLLRDGGRQGGASRREARPYLRPFFRASKTFFTCSVLDSKQTDPFRSVPYILEDFAGVRGLTEFLWMDFLW